MDHPIYAIGKRIQWKWNEEATKLCKGASRVANLFDMPVTMGEYVMVVNEKLQALATFKDAVDIGATALRLGHHEEDQSLQMRFAKDVHSVMCGFYYRKNPFLP